MIEMSEEDDEILMVSFTDALTCVLAASVALFLIFVVFVKLVPTEAPSTQASAQSIMRKAVASDLNQGVSSAIVRIESDCATIESISRIKDASEDWIVRNLDGGACARLFALSSGLSKVIYVKTKTFPTHPVSAFLEVGSTYWPQNGALDLPEVGFTPCGDGTFVLIRIDSRINDYLTGSTVSGCNNP